MMSDHHAHTGPHAEGDTTGVHGMLLFGEEEFYLSHLPMFASPHNFQVLLEVSFDDPVRDVLLSDRQAAGAGIRTFVPEPFPIVELEPGGDKQARTSIEGTIFRGHFERGGEPIAGGVVAQVQDVVAFRELDVSAQRREDQTLTYLCLGRGGQLHLAHEVTARPDFDHVLTARLVRGTATDLAGRSQDGDLIAKAFRGDRVEFGDRNETPEERLAPGGTAQGVFRATLGPAGSHGFAAQVEIGEEVYIEIGELS
jgi:hypothetical protein